jgi:cytochrome b6-f complex iron-sulfur subunit
MEEENAQPITEPPESEGGDGLPSAAVVRGGGIASRRQFIQFGLVVLGVSVVGEVAWVLLKGLEPGAQAAPQPVEVEVGDIPVGGTKDFLYGNDPAIVMRTDDEFQVLSLVCTHLGCIVKWKPESQTFHCPCHAGTFDKNGRVTGGPPPAPLERFAFKRTGDKIIVGG